MEKVDYKSGPCPAGPGPNGMTGGSVCAASDRANLSYRLEGGWTTRVRCPYSASVPGDGLFPFQQASEITTRTPLSRGMGEAAARRFLHRDRDGVRGQRRQRVLAPGKSLGRDHVACAPLSQGAR